MVVFDLDGFKAYNDSYGHPAGDALLRRLGDRLSAFVAGRGGAYRLGGDEFCLLAECSAAEVDGLVAGAAASLGERGDGFVVTAAQGSVLIPVEAHDPRGGAAAGRPAHVREQEPRTGLRRGPVDRSAADRAARGRTAACTST